MSFREDGAAAVDWVASYLERLREQPVLAQVEPGELRARLPAAPPDGPEPFADVLRDLDEVLLPGITHWQSPRFFAYFATTGSEPAILAELLLAGLNQVGILWRTSPALQELEEVTLDWLAQLLGLPSGLHGHLEDTASTATSEGLRTPIRRLVRWPMQSTCGFAIAWSTRSVGSLSKLVWTLAITQSSCARSSSATSSSPFARMFTSIPLRTRKGASRSLRARISSHWRSSRASRR